MINVCDGCNRCRNYEMLDYCESYDDFYADKTEYWLEFSYRRYTQNSLDVELSEYELFDW